MCGIAGVLHVGRQRIERLDERLALMNARQRHRGPDGEGVWMRSEGDVGFGHVRLSIIDLVTGDQPMHDREAGLTIAFNGEIYNYKDVRSELAGKYAFETGSDTEVILKAYRQWGAACVEHLRGMFAFLIWDERAQALYAARDRFGIKPLYFGQVGDTLYFASEIKALLPFIPQLAVNRQGLQDYLTFQFCLRGKTLFEGIEELPPATWWRFSAQGRQTRQYWRVNYQVDLDHTERWFAGHCRELMDDSVRVHLVSDVPVGSYLSGGIDSSALAVLGRRSGGESSFMGFHGLFDYGAQFDESRFALDVARQEDLDLHRIPITSQDFLDSFERLIYHLDFPVAGPGSFPQYMVSKYIKGRRKVVLGGQGGDEIFGGYVRYLIAYFEQCFQGAIQGRHDDPRFIVTYESIIPNLKTLAGYEPLMRHFFGQGMFEDYDRRYFRLVDRSGDLASEVRWEALRDYDVQAEFREVYFSNAIGKQCYFDSMLHFDFLTLLPALLQVEDRMGMAHGIESRTPFLDHPLVEFVATIPANVKFKGGELKRLPKMMFADVLPPSILGRKDKMGFPVPLVQWYKTDLKPFLAETFDAPSRSGEQFLDYGAIRECIAREEQFGRKVWGFLCLDRFFKLFFDAHADIRFR
jgi:asparagine synthase (glutamine-hydrolysing)